MWGYANIMKILTNENYEGLLQLIADQKKEIIYLRSCIQTLKTMKEVHLKPMADFQEVKKQFEAFMNEPTIIFPNTDERGLGEGDTPTDLSPLDL